MEKWIYGKTKQPRVTLGCSASAQMVGPIISMKGQSNFAIQFNFTVTGVGIGFAVQGVATTITS